MLEFRIFSEHKTPEHLIGKIMPLINYDEILIIVENACNYKTKKVYFEKGRRKTLEIVHLGLYCNILLSSDVMPRDAMSEQMRDRRGEAPYGAMSYYQTTEDYIHVLFDLLNDERLRTNGDKKLKKIIVQFINPSKLYPEFYNFTLPNNGDNQQLHHDLKACFQNHKPKADSIFIPNIRMASEIITAHNDSKKIAIYAFSANPSAWLADLINERPRDNKDKNTNNPITCFQCSRNHEVIQRFEVLDSNAPNCAIATDYLSVKNKLLKNQGKNFKFFMDLYVIMIFGAMLPGNEEFDDLDECVPATRYSYMRFFATNGSDPYNKYLRNHPYSFLYPDLYYKFLNEECSAHEFVSKSEQNTRHLFYYMPFILTVVLTPITALSTCKDRPHKPEYQCPPGVTEKDRSDQITAFIIVYISTCVSLYVAYHIMVEIQKYRFLGGSEIPDNQTRMLRR